MTRRWRNLAFAYAALYLIYMPLNTSETALATAIGTYGAAAATAFNAADTELTTGRRNDESEERWETRKSKLKGAMASSLQQLEHAAKLVSDQRRRVGLDALVEVMESTRDIALKTNIQITAHVEAPATPSLAALADLLTKLAAIAPVAVWEGIAPDAETT